MTLQMADALCTLTFINERSSSHIYRGMFDGTLSSRAIVTSKDGNAEIIF